MHAAYDGNGTPGGRMLILRVQSEGGGSMAQYPGVEGPHVQSSLIAIDGWRYYRAPSVEGNNLVSYPHVNNYAGSPYLGDVMNERIWMNDNIIYFNGPTPGSSIMGSNVPPGPITNSVYAPYVNPPVWNFR